MAAYVIGIVQILNPEDYKEYSKLVPDSLAPYSGRFIARGGQHEFLEGAIPANRVVIIDFDSYERALDWYNSDTYQGAKLKRQAASAGTLVLVQGI